MRIILLVLISALIAKDAAYLNDPYVMRGIAQGLCLLIGGGWLLFNLSSGILFRYWPLFGYIIILFLSSLGIESSFYSFFQVGSLAAVIFFFISYFESQNRENSNSISTLVNATVAIYSLVALFSLISAKYLPSLAYDHVYGDEVRFRGLFSKSAMLGAASGLLMGLAWFGINKRWIKIAAVVLGGICLALTFSRTFWIATIIALGSTFWIYARISKKIILILGFLVLATTALVITFDYKIDSKAASKIVRIDSVENLSGRISMWELGINAFKSNPYLGRGFTLGANALDGKSIYHKQGELEAGREAGRVTLHNGYLQVLLDSGVIGMFFYVAIIILSLKRLYKLDADKAYPSMFYSLIFLAIANIGENVIYSASVFHSVMFWAVATFALSMKRS